MDHIQLQLLGRAVALVEQITDMPHRVVAKIASQPILMVQPWLKDATIADDDELTKIMSQIDEIPTTLTPVQQGDFWIGYHQQRGICDTRLRIGNQLRSVRLSKGMSLEDVAEIVGTTKYTISKIETGKWSVGIDLLDKVCTALDVTLTMQ